MGRPWDRQGPAEPGSPVIYRHARTAGVRVVDQPATGGRHRGYARLCRSWGTNASGCAHSPTPAGVPGSSAGRPAGAAETEWLRREAWCKVGDPDNRRGETPEARAKPAGVRGGRRETRTRGARTAP
jgi:hypothetical protein